MRILLIAAISYAAGAAAFVWLLDGTAGIILALCCAVGGVICTILRKRNLFLRAAIALFAVSFSLLYCCIYQMLIVAPAEQLAGSKQTYTVEITKASSQSSSGQTTEGVVCGENRKYKIKLFYSGKTSYYPGDLVTFSGTLNTTLGSAQQSTGLSNAARGIYLSAYLPENAACTAAAKTPLRYTPEKAAIRVREVVQKLYDAPASGLICALLTGERSGLSDALSDEMSATGVYHTVAVSGLHVSILIGLLGFFLRRRRRLMAAIGIPVLFFFVLMTGASPSAVRAAVMQLFLLLAPLVRRENDPPTTLAAAALLILLQNPYAIASIAFQLSFLACAGILLFSERLQRMFTPKNAQLAPRKKDPAFRRAIKYVLRGCIGILSVSISAQLLTMPLTMWYFGRISILAPLTNLLTSAAVTGIFGLSAISTVLGMVWLPLGIPVAAVANVLARYFLLVVQILAKLPFASLYDFSPYTVLFLLFLYIQAAFLLVPRKHARPVIPICSSVIVLCTCLILNILSFDTSEFVFSALDVGQGQCLTFVSGGGTVMVDCGGSSGAQAAQKAAAYLASMGQNRLDVLILTHYDSDHTGGVAALLERISVGLIIGPDYDEESEEYTAIRAAADKTDTDFITITNHSAEITIGAGTLTILPPVSYTNGNNASLSIVGSFQNYDILITGDMDTAAEHLLVKQYELSEIDLLVAGHHGAASSTGEELLQATEPAVVVVSVGENNYGHPSTQMLARVSAVGASVYRTDVDGTITIRR